MAATCSEILKSGPRAGEPCNKPSPEFVQTPDGLKHMCRLHARPYLNSLASSRYPRPISFGQQGLKLSILMNLDSVVEAIQKANDIDILKDAEALHELAGYINVRIQGSPIFPIPDYTVPLALFPDGGHLCRIDFTHALLAHHIARGINEILERPDIYPLDPDVHMDNLRLHGVEYDPYNWQMYLVQLSVVS